MRTLIIAEAGVNHNGDFLIAKKLVDVAASAGADIVKFQTFEASKLTTKYVQKAGYQKSDYDDTQSQFNLLKSLELSKEEHFQLREYCKLKNIEFLSTFSPL